MITTQLKNQMTILNASIENAISSDIVVAQTSTIANDIVSLSPFNKNETATNSSVITTSKATQQDTVLIEERRTSTKNIEE